MWPPLTLCSHLVETAYQLRNIDIDEYMNTCVQRAVKYSRFRPLPNVLKQEL